MYCLEFAGEATDEPIAALEAERAAASALDRVAPGLATARGLRIDRVPTLAYTRRASELVGRTDADVGGAVALLDAASIDRTGTVAVRARNVRSSAEVSTAAAERDAGFGSRAPTDRPFFQPGSMAPVDARAYVNLAAGPTLPDATVLDPMCGTGGFLLEAGLIGARPVGSDAQWKMARGTAENLADVVPDTRWDVVRGDATALPFADDVADAVVFDAPYGRQSKIAGHELEALVGGALVEAARLAPSCVLVGDRSYEEAARDAGWTVDSRFERRVHGSLTRHVHVLRRA